MPAPIKPPSTEHDLAISVLRDFFAAMPLIPILQRSYENKAPTESVVEAFSVADAMLQQSKTPPLIDKLL